MQNHNFEMGGDPVQETVKKIRQEFVEESGQEAHTVRLAWFRDIRAQKRAGAEQYQQHPDYQKDSTAKVIDVELEGKEKQYDALEQRFGHLTDEQINQVIDALKN